MNLDKPEQKQSTVTLSWMIGITVACSGYIYAVYNGYARAGFLGGAATALCAQVAIGGILALVISLARRFGLVRDHLITSNKELPPGAFYVISYKSAFQVEILFWISVLTGLIAAIGLLFCLIDTGSRDLKFVCIIFITMSIAGFWLSNQNRICMMFGESISWTKGWGPFQHTISFPYSAIKEIKVSAFRGLRIFQVGGRKVNLQSDSVLVMGYIPHRADPNIPGGPLGDLYMLKEEVERRMANGRSIDG